MIVAHKPSGTTYCDQHFQVVDERGRCRSCEARPRPSVYVDPNAVRRWLERIDASSHEVIPTIQRIVTTGHEVPGTGAFPECLYFAHDDYPAAVVVVNPHGGGINGAAVTVLRAEFLASMRAGEGPLQASFLLATELRAAEPR